MNKELKEQKKKKFNKIVFNNKKNVFKIPFKYFKNKSILKSIQYGKKYLNNFTQILYNIDCEYE